MPFIYCFKRRCAITNLCAHAHTFRPSIDMALERFNMVRSTLWLTVLDLVGRECLVWVCSLKICNTRLRQRKFSCVTEAVGIGNTSIVECCILNWHCTVGFFPCNFHLTFRFVYSTIVVPVPVFRQSIKCACMQLGYCRRWNFERDFKVMRVIFGSFYNKFTSLEIEVSERIIRFQLHMPHGTVADDTEYFRAHQKHTDGASCPMMCRLQLVVASVICAWIRIPSTEKQSWANPARAKNKALIVPVVL